MFGRIATTPPMDAMQPFGMENGNTATMARHTMLEITGRLILKGRYALIGGNAGGWILLCGSLANGVALGEPGDVGLTGREIKKRRG
jgi:hypothetical protein